MTWTTAMKIELTERAAEEIRGVMSREGIDPATTALRVDVRPTPAPMGDAAAAGYVLDLAANWSPQEDEVLESRGIRIVCRKQSLPQLEGVHIDFRDEAAGRGFAFDRPGPKRDAAEAQDAPPPTEDEVRSALEYVIDPEVGINIVDLGLVYDIAIEQRQVKLTMTMTTPACPLSEHIKQDAQHNVLARCPGAVGVQTELVWDPPWSPKMMSAQARQQMGWARE